MSAPAAPPSISALLDRIKELEDALENARTGQPPPLLPPSPSPPRRPPPAPPSQPAAIGDVHNWNVIGPLAGLLGLAGLLLLLLLAAALFYFRKNRRVVMARLGGLRTITSTLTLERAPTFSNVVVELPASSVERRNDAPRPSEVTGPVAATPRTDPVEVERDAGRQLLRDKIAESGGGGGGGGSLGRASTGRMSPLPADTPHFDVLEAISGAGSADAALLAAVCRYATAAEVRELLEHGASPNTSFLHHSALALAVRGCSSQTSQALLDARANVDSKDPQGWTALMHAVDAHSATFSREAVVAQLLDAGAAVDVWGHDLRGPFELMQEKAGVGEQSHSGATGGRRPWGDTGEIWGGAPASMRMRNQMHCACACTCTSSHRRRGAPTTEPVHTASLSLCSLRCMR